MIKDLREKVKMYMQLYVFVDIVKKDSPLSAKVAERGSACRKSPPAAAFSAKTRFPCAFGAAGETCKETLLRKASESTAHVAGFGIQLGGLRPSEPPGRFFDSLSPSLRK